MPYQPSAAYTWSTHNFASGVFPATDIYHNTGGHLSSSGRFTAPVSGAYFISGTWMNGSNTTTRVSLAKNGSMSHHNGVSYNHTQTYDRGSITNILTLNAGDYVEFIVNSGYGGIHQYHGNIVFRLLG
jgi:hypothetical protein